MRRTGTGGPYSSKVTTPDREPLRPVRAGTNWSSNLTAMGATTGSVERSSPCKTMRVVAEVMARIGAGKEKFEARVRGEAVGGITVVEFEFGGGRCAAVIEAASASVGWGRVFVGAGASSAVATRA